MDNIILVGFGGHAKSVADTIERSNRFHIVGYTDRKPLENYQDYKWLGTDEVLKQYHGSGVNYAFICVGYLGHSDVRNKLYTMVKEIGFHLPVIVDPSAVVAGSAKIEEGTFIGKRAVINAGVSIGKMCIINSGAVIEHDCEIGAYAHISVASILCGGVSVGESTFVGANATVIQMRRIGKGCIIGAGSVIRSNVSDHETKWGINC